ncbi:hypothetical protein HYC85_027374 [Camellia sinensis]|uniref:cysteine--tRNA ligase n=1 Tax=Camellia sinensis TaxID=4442 RepID=A0A7J7G7J6_CAMSI|nr:hypothetical protein HYC85_027374 [Camellia sinensis]
MGQSEPSINEKSSKNTNGDGSEGKSYSELWLYNTMSKQKEVFRPKVPGRYLSHLGYEVNYVRNFTDVDDKVKAVVIRITIRILQSIGAIIDPNRDLAILDPILRSDPLTLNARPQLLVTYIIARANELGEDPISLSRRYCEEFHRDMVHLHCLPPSVEPRVSEHMPQIIDMIKQIIDSGCAYSIDGDVYFSVDKFSKYGRLSGRKLEDNRAGERVAVDSRKKNPADFALWKSAKEGEPFWGSPWGPGRPGWHIECSAMSATYLGYSFDIHGGGMDLIFPHHENEIAQSCTACENSNVSYWIHNGFVTIDSEKMSKSLGNFFTIRQVVDLYHPLALRLFLIGTHYRSPINYSDVQLEKASDRVFYVYQLFVRIYHKPTTTTTSPTPLNLTHYTTTTSTSPTPLPPPLHLLHLYQFTINLPPLPPHLLH